MKPELEGKRDEALSFLVDHETGVLSTVSDGKSHSRLMYYACDESFTIFFLTLVNTRKVADLRDNPHASFVVSDIDIPRTLQVEGIVEDLTEAATANPLLANSVQELMSRRGRYGLPLEHFDEAAVKFYRLTPSWVRWGDFTFGQGTDTVLTRINPAHKEHGIHQ